MNRKNELELLVYRLVSNIENIINNYSKKDINNSEILDDYINELIIEILSAHRELIIIQHNALIENLKKTKVTFVEK